MNKFVQRMLVVVAVLSCVGLAAAQGGGGGGQGRQGRGGMQRGMRGNNEMGLAMRPDVQKELAVTEDQKKKLEELRDKNRQNNGGGRNGGGNGGGGNGGGTFNMEEFQKRMAEQRAQQKKDLAAILNETQMKRLGELVLQRDGNNALMQDDVQKALGFTAEQTKKVADLQQKQRDANQVLMEKMRNQELTREEWQEANQKNQKTMSDELAKILTAEQASKLKTMQGKPFTFEETGRGGGRNGN